MTSKKSTLIVLAMVILGNVVIADTQSILERVTVIDDPELGACLRMALDNVLPQNGLRGLNPTSPRDKDAISSYETTKLKVVRAVTELYAQIKLLDEQIAQINVKINEHTPSAIRHELVLAQAELQSKRIQELAKLRETMGVVPRHALGHIQVSQLKTLMVLDVLDEAHVLVFECLSPYTEYEDGRNYAFITQLPSDRVTDYVRTIQNDKQQLPVRVEVLYRNNSFKLSERIHRQLMELTRQANAQIDVDLRLRIHYGGYGSSEYLYLIADKIGCNRASKNMMVRLEPNRARQQKGFSYLTDSLEPNQLNERIGHTFFLRPGSLPATWVFEHDEPGKKQAQEYIKKIKSWAKENDMEGYINVSSEMTKRSWYEHYQLQEAKSQN